MVVLIDWNEQVVFNTKKVIDAVRHTLFKGIDETIDFKWFLLPEGEKTKTVKFFVRPQTNAIKFPKNYKMKKGEENLFRLEVDSKKLPDTWSGELLIESEGVTRKVVLEFEKTAATY